MANENELQIVLSLVDNATKDVKKALDEIKGKLDETGKGGKKANETIQNEFKKSRQQLNTFKQNITSVILVLTALVMATKEYARFNSDARKSVDEFNTSLQKLSYYGGMAIEKLGILKGLTMAAKGWAMIGDLASNIASGKGAVLSSPGGADQVTQTMEAEAGMRRLNDAVKENQNAYIAGSMSIQEYYQTLQNGEYQAMQLRQMAMAQMQELSSLTLQVNNEEIMSAQAKTEEQINLLNYYKEVYQTSHAGIKTLVVSLGKSIQENLSSALVDVIMNVKSAKEAFMEFGKAMIRVILDFIIQKVIAAILEKTLLAGFVASSSAAAAVLAAAWAPAAAMVSLASFGANAAPATAGIIATNAMALGMAAMGTAANAAANAPGAVGALKGIAVGINAGMGGAQAEGGDYMVNRPTVFLAGEAGPERATFTPLGKSGNSNTSNVHIEINNPIVTTMQNIDELVTEISRRLNFATERIYQ